MKQHAVFCSGGLHVVMDAGLFHKVHLHAGWCKYSKTASIKIVRGYGSCRVSGPAWIVEELMEGKRVIGVCSCYVINAQKLSCRCRQQERERGELGHNVTCINKK